jgi:hypothetical protein
VAILENMVPAVEPGQTFAEIPLSATHGKCEGTKAVNFGWTFTKGGVKVFKPEVGKWERGSSSQTTIGSANYRGQLSLQPEMETLPLQEYVFSFDIENPSKKQDASPIQIQVDGMGIDASRMDVDEGLLNSPSCCSEIGDLECFKPGEGPKSSQAAPMAITDPYFCRASIAHDNPYPCDLNCLTITVAANAMLRRGETEITITGLTGASFPFAGIGQKMINITSGSAASPLDHTFFSYSATDRKPGTALFDNTAKRLTLVLAKDLGCGETFVIKFCVFNPDRFQSDPDIRICASKIGRSRDLYSSAQDIICQAMDKISPSNYIAYPLRVKYPDFSYSLQQTSRYPCDINIITLSMRSAVPIIKECAPCITISSLNGIERPRSPLTGNPVPASGNPPVTIATDEDDEQTGQEALTYTEKAGNLCAEGTSAVAFCMQASLRVHDGIRRYVPSLADTKESMMAKFGIDATFQVSNKQSRVSKASANVQVCYKMGMVQSTDNCLSQTNPLDIIVPRFETTTATPVAFTNAHSLQNDNYLTVFPCEQETVVVTLRSNVKVFKKCSGQDVNIVLGGLTIFQTQIPADSMAYKVPSTGDPMLKPGALTGGMFTMPVAQLVDRLAPEDQFLNEDTEYSLSFTRFISENNGNTVTTTITAQITTSGSPTALDIMCNSTPLATVKVACLILQATIGQSTTYPCQINTISISLRASVPLLQTCGTTEATRTWPKLTISGLGLISTDSNSALELVSDPFPASMGEWDAAADTLKIILTADLLQNTPYKFNIVVKNSPEHQTNPVLIRIDKLTVCPNPTSVGELLITQPYLRATSAVTQSSPYPCADNMITVKVDTSVPLMEDCVPKVTVSGLTGSCTADAPTASVTSSTSGPRFATTGGWSKTAGQIIVAAVGEHIETASDPFTRSFSIVVKNPAATQVAPQLTMTVTFNKALYGGPKNTLTSISSGMTSGMTSTFTGAPSADTFTGPPTAPYAASAAPSAFEQYPMYIMPLRLRAFAAQSSPFPCDDNTISVWVQTNVPLLKSCAPKITVSGLAGTQTATVATGFAVTMLAGDGINIKGDGAGSYTGAWTGGSTGSMVLDLTLAAHATAQNLLTDANSVDVLLMTFTVKNPKLASNCVLTYVKIELLSCATTQSSPVQLTHTEDSDGTRIGFLETASSPVVSWPVRSASTLATPEYAMKKNESCPLRIRQATVNCLNAPLQTSTYPCAENTVTVTLQTNVPYGDARIAGCAFITIGGLSLFQTETSAATLAAVSVTLAGGSGASALFDTETSIKVTPSTASVMAYDTYHVLSFTRYNKQTMSVSSDNKITITSEFHSSTQIQCPWSLMYTQPTCMAVSITQSSDVPCATNTITVNLRSKVPLLGTCGDQKANQMRPKITISGMRGFSDGQNTLIVTANSGGENVAVANTWAGPSLSESLSLMIVTLSADLRGSGSDVDLTITFTATNSPVSSLDSPSVGISVDRISSPTPCRLGSVNILDPAFLSSSSVQQSTAYPCAVNTITVNVDTNVPLFSAKCVPKFTVTGLTGSCTSDTTTATITPVNLEEAEDSATFNSPGVWTQTVGRIVVASSLDDTGISAGSYAHRFTFQITNPAKSQSAPSVILEGSFNKANFVSQPWSIIATSMPQTKSGAPNYDFKSVPDYNSVPGEKPYTAYAAPSAFEQYPMYIMPLRLRAFAAQSSPFPCDDNTISVWVQTNVPLLKSCAPKITVSGLAGTQTATVATGFAVTMLAGDGINIKGDGAGSYTGAWTGGSTGSMVLDLTLAAHATAQNLLTDANSVDVLLMTFTVKNPNQQRRYVTPTVNLGLSDPCSNAQSADTGSAGSFGDGDSEMVLADATTAGVYYPDTFGENFQAMPFFKADRVCLGEACGVPTNSGPRWFEARPLEVRGADFFTEGRPNEPYLHASTENPCALNTVAITLHSYVPLFQTCGGLATKISITGLDVFQTWTTACGAGDYAILQSGAELNTTAAVKADTFLVFELTTNLLADKAVVLILQRHNHMEGAPATGRQGIVSVKATAGIAACGPTATACAYTSETAQFYDRLRISKLWWRQNFIGHKTSNGQPRTSYPCDTSTISVTLQSNIHLLDTCGLACGTRARPKIMIDFCSGDTKIVTSPANSATVPVTFTEPSAMSGTGQWTSTGSKLTVQLAQNLVGQDANTDVLVFSFNVVNTNAWGSRGACVQVDQVQRGDGKSIGPLQGDLSVMAPQMKYATTALSAAAALDSTCGSACGHQTITVTIKTSVPMLALCIPTITISNLVGDTKTPNTPAGSNMPLGVGTGVWTKSSTNVGQLVVNVNGSNIATLEAKVYSMVFSFSLQNPSSGLNAGNLPYEVSMKFGSRDWPAFVSKRISQECERPLFVKRPVITLSSQSSSIYPCDDNILELFIESDIDILVCPDSCNVITIKGLSGVTVPALTELKSDQNNIDTSVTLASFDPATGTLTFRLTGKITTGTKMTLTLPVKNSEKVQSAPVLGFTLSCREVVLVGGRNGARIVTPWNTVTAPCIQHTTNSPGVYVVRDAYSRCPFSPILLPCCQPRLAHLCTNFWHGTAPPSM